VKLNPIIVCFTYGLALLKGQGHIQQSIPHNPDYPDGFEPFLHIKVDKPPATAPVRLLVKFKVGNLNLWHRKMMPVLGIPFFAGAPGFMEKVFLLNEVEKTFSGFYTWRSKEDAEIYIQSYAAKVMALNSRKGSLEMTISPITE
jgi:hypothetical protein